MSYARTKFLFILYIWFICVSSWTGQNVFQKHIARKNIFIGTASVCLLSYLLYYYVYKKNHYRVDNSSSVEVENRELITQVDSSTKKDFNNNNHKNEDEKLIEIEQGNDSKNEIYELNDAIKKSDSLKACMIFNKIYDNKSTLNNWESFNVDGFLKLLSNKEAKSHYIKKYIDLDLDLESNKKVKLALRVPLSDRDTENLKYLKEIFYNEIEKKAFKFDTFDLFTFIDCITSSYYHEGYDYNTSKEDIIFETLKFLQEYDYHIDPIMERSNRPITLLKFYIHRKQTDNAFQCFQKNCGFYIKNGFLYEKIGILNDFLQMQDQKNLETIFTLIWKTILDNPNQIINFFYHFYKNRIAMEIIINGITPEIFVSMLRGNEHPTSIESHIEKILENFFYYFEEMPMDDDTENKKFMDFCLVNIPHKITKKISGYFYKKESEFCRKIHAALFEILLKNECFQDALLCINKYFSLEELAEYNDGAFNLRIINLFDVLNEQMKRNKFISILETNKFYFPILGYYIQKKDKENVVIYFELLEKIYSDYFIDFLGFFSDSYQDQKMYLEKYKEKICFKCELNFKKFIVWLSDNNFSDEIFYFFKMHFDCQEKLNYRYEMNYNVLKIIFNSIGNKYDYFEFFKRVLNNHSLYYKKNIEAFCVLLSTKPAAQDAFLEIIQNDIVTITIPEDYFNYLLEQNNFVLAKEIYNAYSQKLHKNDRLTELYQDFFNKQNTAIVLHMFDTYFPQQKKLFLDNLFASYEMNKNILVCARDYSKIHNIARQEGLGYVFQDLDQIRLNLRSCWANFDNVFEKIKKLLDFLKQSTLSGSVYDYSIIEVIMKEFFDNLDNQNQLFVQQCLDKNIEKFYNEDFSSLIQYILNIYIQTDLMPYEISQQLYQDFDLCNFVKNITWDSMKDSQFDTVLNILKNVVKSYDHYDFFLLIIEKTNKKIFLKKLYENLSETEKNDLQTHFYTKLNDIDNASIKDTYMLLKNMSLFKIVISEDLIKNKNFISKIVTENENETIDIQSKILYILGKNGFYIKQKYDGKFLLEGIGHPLRQHLLITYGLYTKEKNFKGRWKQIKENDNLLCIDLISYFEQHNINNFEQWRMSFRSLSKYQEQNLILIRQCFSVIRTLKLHKTKKLQSFNRVYDFVNFLSGYTEFALSNYISPQKRIADLWLISIVDSLIFIPRDEKEKKLIKNELQYFNAFINRNPPITCTEKINHKTAPYWLLYHDFYPEFQKIQKILGITAAFKEAVVDLNQNVAGFNNDTQDSVLELIKQKKSELESQQLDLERKQVEENQEIRSYFQQIIEYGITNNSFNGQAATPSLL